MLIVEGLLVGLTVICAEFFESWLAYPMIRRPMVVGPVIGLLLGDLETGVLVGASLELIFMGVVGIGGTTPPDATTGTAIGTAFAIILGEGTEVALALAVPASILATFTNTIFLTGRGLFNPYIDKLVNRGDYKKIEMMVPVVSLFSIVPKGIVAMMAIMIGSTAVQAVVAQVPAVVMGGLSVASGMMAAVGFALLLKMIWSKTLAVYYFLGFAMVSYMNLPLLAVAMFGVILTIVLYLEGSFNKQPQAVQVSKDEEDLFND